MWSPFSATVMLEGHFNSALRVGGPTLYPCIEGRSAFGSPSPCINSSSLLLSLSCCASVRFRFFGLGSGKAHGPSFLLHISPRNVRLIAQSSSISFLKRSKIIYFLSPTMRGLSHVMITLFATCESCGQKRGWSDGCFPYPFPPLSVPFPSFPYPFPPFRTLSPLSVPLCSFPGGLLIFRTLSVPFPGSDAPLHRPWF